MAIYSLAGCIPIDPGDERDLREIVQGLERLPNPVGEDGPFILSKSKFSCSTTRKLNTIGGPAPCVYATCLAHRECSVRWQVLQLSGDFIRATHDPTFIGERGLVVLGKGGRHGEEESEQNIRAQKRKIKAQLLHTPSPLASRNALLESDHVPDEYVPTRAEVYAHRKYHNKKQRSELPSGTKEELQAWLAEVSSSDDPVQPVVQIEHATLEPEIVIPFTAKALLDQGVAAIARSGSVNLVADFTHDVCKQRMKLGAICFLGLHLSIGLS